MDNDYAQHPEFQPTLPARGATALKYVQRQPRIFQPTLPARGATSFHPRAAGIARHFNPRSPHGERPERPWKRTPTGAISTHAPRTGSDAAKEALVRAATISTHAPRTGSDPARWRTSCGARRFQPTLPARGATWAGATKSTRPRYFNPRSPHGERPPQLGGITMTTDFNPRSPHGERPNRKMKGVLTMAISTHAPRTGSDRRHGTPRLTRADFNPRSPHGERPATLTTASSPTAFQPTLPARGATHCTDGLTPQGIHFNPRSPHGERQATKSSRAQPGNFNPRSPHGERPLLCASSA